eukprot:3317892-Amphidinium_carterae.1
MVWCGLRVHLLCSAYGSSVDATQELFVNTFLERLRSDSSAAALSNMLASPAAIPANWCMAWHARMRGWSQWSLYTVAATAIDFS